MGVFGHKYAVADLLKIHKEHLMTIKYHIAYHVQQRWGEKKRHAWLGYDDALHDDNPTEVAVGAEGGKTFFPEM